MKKLTVALTIAILISVSMAFAGTKGIKPQNVSVVGSSTLILPAVTPTNYNDWVASTAYTVGEYASVYTNDHYQNFYVITAGTSETNAPTWSTSADVTDNGVTWRYINKRTSCILANLGTGVNTFVAYDNAAVASKGIILLKSAANELVSDYLGEIYGINTGATNTITIHQQ